MLKEIIAWKYIEQQFDIFKMVILHEIYTYTARNSESVKSLRFLVDKLF